MERIKLNIQKFASNNTVEVELLATVENLLNSINRATKSLKTLKDGIKETKDETSNFDKVAKEIKSAFSNINFSGLFNQIKRLGKSLYSNFLTKAIDTSEELNLFNVVFDNMQKNGETTFSELGKKATEFQNKLNEAFGTNKKETMRYQGLFQAMGESAGLNEDVANLMSENMTKLAYDLASLYNTTETKAAESLRAGVYAGQTKPLRNYGIDVTQTSFKPIMDELGLEKSVSELTQAEKEVLRYISTLRQAQNAMGDFANTIESPANQLKVLKQQFYEMQAAIGNLFVGAFSRILPYVNAIIMVIKELAKAIASLFGIEMSDYNTGIASYEENLDDYSDSLGGVADSADGASDSIKALRRQTLAFDQINNLTSPTPSSGSGGAGAGAGGGVLGGIDEKLLAALKGYENGMEAVRMKASEIRDKIMEWLGFIYDSEKGVWRLKDGWQKIHSILTIIGTLGLITLVKKIIDKVVKLYDWVSKIKGVLGGTKKAAEGAEKATKGFAKQFEIAGSSALGMAGIITSAVIQTVNLAGQTKKIKDEFDRTKSIFESIKPTSFGDFISKVLALGTMGTTPLGTLTVALVENSALAEKLGEIFGGTSTKIKKEVADIKKKLDPVREDLYKFSSDFAQLQIGVVLDENAGETIMGHLDKIMNAINSKLTTQKQEMIDQLNDLLARGLISEEDYATSMDKLNTFYNGAEKETSEAYNKINEIITTASNEKRKLSTDEVNIIKGNLDTINKYTVESLTDNKNEQVVLLEEIKNETERITVETASNRLKEAKKTKDETIKNAEEEYNGLLEKFKKWKELGLITDETYDAMVTGAEQTRTQTVLEAVSQYNEIYDALKKNNSNVAKYIDKDTGGIKKSWKKHYDDVNKDTVKQYDTLKKTNETGMKKVQKSVNDTPITATMKLDTSDARKSYNRLINDIDNSKANTDVKLKTPYTIDTYGLYAKGGMPSVGEMFIAREAGPEMVGKIGNKTTVANNDQIVKGIEQGVYNAVTSAISSGGLGSVQIDLHTDEGVVVDKINKITRQTGVCPINI